MVLSGLRQVAQILGCVSPWFGQVDNRAKVGLLSNKYSFVLRAGASCGSIQWSSDGVTIGLG